MNSQPKTQKRKRRPVQVPKRRKSAKILNLPEEKRALINRWFNDEGADACLKRLKEEMDITISRSCLYDTHAKWRTDALYDSFHATALAVAEREAKEKGFTPEQMEEAVDRNFIMLAANSENVELYLQLRRLRVADQKAKRQNDLAEAKLKQGAKALEQKDKALELSERRVALLAQKIEEAKQVTQSETLSAEERAQRVREILGD